MTSKKVKHVSLQQLDILYEFLSAHKDVAIGYNRTLQSKEYSNKKWKEIAKILNSQGVCVCKSPKEWSKYWIDLKSKIKKKAYEDTPLSDIEEKFLLILGDDVKQDDIPGGSVEEKFLSILRNEKQAPRGTKRTKEPVGHEASSESGDVNYPQNQSDSESDGHASPISPQSRGDSPRLRESHGNSQRNSTEAQVKQRSASETGRILLRTARVRALTATRTYSVLNRMAGSIDRIAQAQEGILRILTRLESSLSAVLPQK